MPDRDRARIRCGRVRIYSAFALLLGYESRVGTYWGARLQVPKVVGCDCVDLAG